MESLLDGRPGTRLTAPDGNRSVRAVAIIILNVEIALRFAKVRQDLVIRPFIVAERRPGIEILGETPLHGLTVDRRPSADHLALRHVDRPLLLGDGAPQGPVVLRVRGFGEACVAELDFVRKMGWIDGPRFQQQHGSARVCSQSARQHRSGGSPADNHHVIFHELSFTDIPRLLASAIPIVSPFRAGRNKRTHDKYSWLPPSKRNSAVDSGRYSRGAAIGLALPSPRST